MYLELPVATAYTDGVKKDRDCGHALVETNDASDGAWQTKY